jgi:transposase
MKIKQRLMRQFSKEFKKEKVQLLFEKKITVKELSTLYSVSETSIYKWIKAFSTLPANERMVIEKESEERKNLALLKKIADLEGIIGKQQVEVLFLESVIACGSNLMGEDLKKKFATLP